MCELGALARALATDRAVVETQSHIGLTWNKAYSVAISRYN